MSKPSTINHQPSTVFNDYARYYDLLYRDKDYASEVDYVAGLISRFHPETHSILEFGSGTGIHAIHLAEKGYEVTGIDLSLDMVNIARSNVEATLQPSTYFLEGDIREIRLKKRFDVVIALFHVISYQTTNEDVTAAFETARHHLNPDGIFIFDVWYGPAVLTERPEVRIKRMADDQTAVCRLAEPVLYPNENRGDVQYSVFVRDRDSQAVTELKETHRMRYFFKPEMSWFAAQARFKLTHSEEWMSGKAIGCDTWGVCFVLKA